MKISVVTVVYNNEKTIEEAIRSVRSQTYPDIEHVIIDGGSVDNTVPIISSYKDSLGYFISEPDKGLYDAMNKGITKCTGDVIAILNSDDLYQDDSVLADVMARFNSDPELNIVYGDIVYVKADDTTKVVRNWKSKPYYDSFFDHGHVPPHPALFLRKKVYEEAGTFNTKYRLASDYDFMLRVFKKFNYNSLHIPRVMVRMRLGGETNKSIANIVKGNKEIIDSWKENDIQRPWWLMPIRMYRRFIQFF